VKQLVSAVLTKAESHIITLWECDILLHNSIFEAILGGLYLAPLFHMESMWNLCGIHVVPHGLCPFHMEYVLAEISPILVIFFHLYSTWNGVDSM